MNIYIYIRVYIYDVYLYLWVCRPYNWDNYTLRYLVDANGHFRSRNWRYLPHIISHTRSLCKGYVREYPKKYGLCGTVYPFLGCWNSNWNPYRTGVYPVCIYIYIDELYYGYQPLSNWNAHRRRVKQTNMRMSWGHHEDIVDLPYSYLFLVSCV